MLHFIPFIIITIISAIVGCKKNRAVPQAAKKPDSKADMEKKVYELRKECCAEGIKDWNKIDAKNIAQYELKLADNRLSKKESDEKDSKGEVIIKSKSRSTGDETTTTTDGEKKTKPLSLSKQRAKQRVLEFLALKSEDTANAVDDTNPTKTSTIKEEEEDFVPHEMLIEEIKKGKVRNANDNETVNNVKDDCWGKTQAFVEVGKTGCNENGPRRDSDPRIPEETGQRTGSRSGKNKIYEKGYTRGIPWGTERSEQSKKRHGRRRIDDHKRYNDNREETDPGR
ncbi:hypothetical protein PFISCL1PPCAC_17158, partial [Pristionchus fissidentatus]